MSGALFSHKLVWSAISGVAIIKVGDSYLKSPAGSVAPQSGPWPGPRAQTEKYVVYVPDMTGNIIEETLQNNYVQLNPLVNVQIHMLKSVSKANYQNWLFWVYLYVRHLEFKRQLIQ